jgi:hypothetical protein
MHNIYIYLYTQYFYFPKNINWGMVWHCSTRGSPWIPLLPHLRPHLGCPCRRAATATTTTWGRGELFSKRETLRGEWRNWNWIQTSKNPLILVPMDLSEKLLKPLTFRKYFRRNGWIHRVLINQHGLCWDENWRSELRDSFQTRGVLRPGLLKVVCFFSKIRTIPK